jgi:hypothetical protein
MGFHDLLNIADGLGGAVDLRSQKNFCRRFALRKTFVDGSPFKKLLSTVAKLLSASRPSQSCRRRFALRKTVLDDSPFANFRRRFALHKTFVDGSPFTILSSAIRPSQNCCRRFALRKTADGGFFFLM